MQIRVGYELIYDCPQPTPMLLMLHVHPSRVIDLVQPDRMMTEPAVPLSGYQDAFGNWCTRLVAPMGRLRVYGHGVVRDSGLPEPACPDANEHRVADLPDEALMYLLGSRYCETDLMSDLAWRLFGDLPPGWMRVQRICDFVNAHIRFDYTEARSTRTAAETYAERVGVCRDFAHLAVTFCRCLNIPARYCTGYLGDIGVPPGGPMDFAAFFEVYLGGAWHVFDPRNNARRIGRVLMARGRDAVDVALSNTFGPNLLSGFTVWTIPL